MLKKYTPLATDCQRIPGSNTEKLDKANDKYCFKQTILWQNIIHLVERGRKWYINKITL